jgi:hypothetical protein
MGGLSVQTVAGDGICMLQSLSELLVEVARYDKLRPKDVK